METIKPDNEENKFCLIHDLINTTVNSGFKNYSSFSVLNGVPDVGSTLPR